MHLGSLNEAFWASAFRHHVSMGNRTTGSLGASTKDISSVIHLYTHMILFLVSIQIVPGMS